MRRLLVTGGTGYLGRALIDAGAGRGVHVVATWHRTPPPAGSPARWEHLDVADVASVDAVVARAAPDVVIHTASVQGGPDLDAVTARGAAVVAVAARRRGARLVHLSTDVVFDGRKEGAYSEDDEPNPVNAYGRAKAAAERLVLGADPAAAVVRTSLLCGPPPGRQERLVAEAAGGAGTTFYTDELRCPVGVGGVAAALLDVAAGDWSGPLHLAGPETLSRAELAERIALAQGLDPSRLRTGPSPAGDRPRNCALDSSRASDLLGRELAGI